MIDLLADNPLLLLALVLAIGYPLGRVTVAGSGLGPAAVLFVGLAVGALDPRLRLPELIYTLGLVLFVYTLGLGNGAAFFAALRRTGLRDNCLIAGVLLTAGAATALAGAALDLRPTLTAGLFAGSLTNTPALAASLDFVHDRTAPAVRDQLLVDPVVAYSVTYPLGVLGTLGVIVLFERPWRIDYRAEAERVQADAREHRDLEVRTVRITRADVAGRTVRELRTAEPWDIAFGRIQRDGRAEVARAATRLELGDLVTLVGEPPELDRAIAALGEPAPERPELDRREVDFRRVFVSNPDVTGRRLRDLQLPERFGVVMTRLRRGDAELMPRADTVIEPGDRARIVGPQARIAEATAFLGDSYRLASEVDLLSFSLGLGLGLLAGSVPIPLPGELSLKLGLAGGPLLVALVLGALGRTGPIVWSLPYGAGTTLRQLGLMLLLAGIGTRAGSAFLSTLAEGDATGLLLAGVGITMLTATLTLVVGYAVLRIPMGILLGILAGVQTQAAVLGFAEERTRDTLPGVGYATVYPVATLLKIVLAQVFLALTLP